MGYIDPDVYGNPENFGLEIVADINFSGGYEYDMILVLRKLDDGTLYYAEDGGGSHNSPFEDFTSIEWLVPLNRQGFEHIASRVKSELNYEWREIETDEAHRFLAKIKEAMGRAAGTD